MSRRETIAEAILASRALLNRYLSGFDDSNHTRQAQHLPNHVAWCLGHCALTLHRGVERINHEPLPDTDFYTPPPDLAGRTPVPAPPTGATATIAVKATRQGPQVLVTRYDTETICFGSTPVDNPQLYPRFDRCTAIFDSACQRYAAVVRNLPEDRLDAMIQWGQIQIPVWASGLRMAFHNGSHCGQIADLRRALGMRSIFS